MLTIRREQIETFESASRERFVLETMDHLREVFPEETGALEDQDLRAVVERGIEETFSDIQDLAGDCRFTDCTHVSEPGCAVLEAVDNGSLPASRYDSFLKLRKESDYYSRTYLESRRRDRKFGRMVKNIMKNHKKK